MKIDAKLAFTLLTTTALLTFGVAGDSYAFKPALKCHNPGQESSLKVDITQETVEGAHKFIENVSARGLDFLKNPSLSEEDRKKDFRSLLEDSFDLKTIGRFALGTYWRQATDEQKKAYMSLFEDMVIDTYSKRFSEYQGQTVKVERARAEGENDTIVNSKILSTNGSPDVALDWRVRYKNGEYRIIDVLVEGVSMSLTQRSEYASIIQRGGGNIDALLEKLQNR